MSINLPTILLEIDPDTSDIMKTYIYGNSQILAQHTGKYDQPRYFASTMGRTLRPGISTCTIGILEQTV